MSKAIHFYGAIEKFDGAQDGSLLVSGIASSEAVDADGEVITSEAMRKALPAYLQSGTVREMHQPIAAGAPISAFVDDDGKTHFTAKIVDANTIAKVKAGVLKGFSIGGKALKRVGNKITEILLKDISVVDIPNNPESFFTVVKFDKPGEHCDDKDCKTHTEFSKEGDEKKDKEKKKTSDEHETKKVDMSEETIQKIDSLEATVKALAETVNKLATATPDISKVVADIGDLQKKATEAEAARITSERSAIIEKMSFEGRVAYNDSGVAYTAEELQKMDLSLLKFAARNAQVIPTAAKAVYKGAAKPQVDPNLKGSDLVSKAWEQDYSDLNKMLEIPCGQTV